MPTFTINNSTITVNNIWYVSVNGSDATGNGTQLLPYASYDKAAIMASSGDGIYIQEGYYVLSGYKFTSENTTIALYDYNKNLTVWGDGRKTILYFDATSKSSTYASIFGVSYATSPVSASTFLDLYVQFKSLGGDYTSAIWSWATGTYKNIYIENSFSASMSAFYYNAQPANKYPTIVNCQINTNGKGVTSYSGYGVVDNCLYDTVNFFRKGTYSSYESTITNSIQRINGDDDFLFTTQSDCKNTGNASLFNPDGTRSNVGVTGGAFAWFGFLSNVKSSISSMQIGDYIVSNYQAASGQVGVFSNLGSSTSDFIFRSGSATPNGAFYWIYVGNDFNGRKIFVADRNIQHSISWDTLNKSGISTYKGTTNDYTIMCKDLTDTLSVNSFSSSSQYSSSYSAQKAFNNVYNESNGGWQTPSGSSYTSNQWLKVDFSNPTYVDYVRFQNDSSSNYLNTAIKNFRIEASNDDINWTNQHTGVGNIGLGSFTIARFTPTSTFRYWRVYIVDNYGHPSYIMVTECEMKDTRNSIFNSYTNVSLKLLTGGVLNTDFDNEWDDYIVSSTLNGTITAGDSAVWNWGLSSWTSTSLSATSTIRIIRGGATATTYSSVTASSSALSTVGFRPVLIIEDTSITATNDFNLQFAVPYTYTNDLINKVSVRIPAQNNFNAKFTVTASATSDFNNKLSVRVQDRSNFISQLKVVRSAFKDFNQKVSIAVGAYNELNMKTLVVYKNTSEFISQLTVRQSTYKEFKSKFLMRDTATKEFNLQFNYINRGNSYFNETVTVRQSTYKELKQRVDVKYRADSYFNYQFNLFLVNELNAQFTILPNATMTTKVQIMEKPRLTSNTIATKDTLVYEGNPDLNYGDYNLMQEGFDGTSKLFSLVQFGLNLPVNAQIISAKMILNVENIWANNDIVIKTVTSAWDEYGVSWNDKPSEGNILLRLQVNNFGRNEIDITNVVTSWFDGSFANNGLYIQPFDPSIAGALSFSTKEGLIQPRLEIIYLDGLTYTSQKSELVSSFEIPRYSLFRSQVNVQNPWSLSDFQSRFSITVFDGQSDMQFRFEYNNTKFKTLRATFKVRVQEFNEIFGKFDVKYRTTSEFNQNVTVQRSGESIFNGKLKVVYPAQAELNHVVDVISRGNSYLEVFVPVKGVEHSNLLNKVAVRQQATNDLQATVLIYIKSTSDFNNQLTVVRSSTSELSNKVAVRQETNSELNYTAYVVYKAESDFNQVVTVRQNSESEINHEVTVRQTASNELNAIVNVMYRAESDLLANLAVRRTGESELFKSLTVRQTSMSELQVKALVMYKATSNLNQTFTVRRTDEKELNQLVTVRQSSNSDLNATMFVIYKATSDFEQTVTVRRTAETDLNQVLAVRQTSTSDFNSTMFVINKATSDFNQKLTVKQFGSKELNEVVRVRRSSTSEFNEVATIRQRTIKQLRMRVRVGIFSEFEATFQVVISGGYGFIM